MTTKTAGGKISTRISGTFEAQYAAAVGDPVSVTGDYEVEKFDGTNPVIGIVSVANVKRTNTATSTTYPSAEVPGDVTVELFGYGIATLNSGGAFGAGEEVGFNNAGDVVAVGAGVGRVGIALMAATGADEKVDVLLQGGSVGV